MAKGIKFKIDKKELNRLQRVHPKKASDALTALAEEGVTIVKLAITNSPPSGRVYTRGSVSHTASSPGNPPRVDTGALRASIHQESRAPLKKLIADGVEYGIYLEFGTETIEARPFMAPMVLELKEKVPKIFDEYLDDK